LVERVEKWVEGVNALISHLKGVGVKKVYLSHQPEDEQVARGIAARLFAVGINAIVAADVRVKGLAAVDAAIASCDYTVVVSVEGD
jgi:hypothetical protein